MTEELKENFSVVYEVLIENFPNLTFLERKLKPYVD